MRQTETLIWVIYDIHKDKVRNKVAKLCKGTGLYRVQMSVMAARALVRISGRP